MMGHTGYVMTLANSIIGVGILAMPFCFQKCGIILATTLLVLSNWTTRICCHYLIKSSLLTRRKSFEFLGFHAFGSSGKFLVELSIIGYLLGTCITYFVVVGDLGPQIVAKMFALSENYGHLRTVVMIVVTVVCILPLGMLKNVDSLATVCTASIGFYVCLVFKIVLEAEERILANDWTDKVLYWEPRGILQCLPIFSMALSCQMQLFEVFESINNQSLEKLNGIVRNATWICTLVYIAVGFFGYVAFCTHSFSGNILINFSPSFGSDVIKIGFILSVAFSFPLVIFPCRASLYSLLYRKGHTDATGYIPESRFKAITIFIVGFALSVALIIPSVELVIGLVGSTIGVIICIMFPAACFRKIVKKESTERSLAQFIIVSGFCLMILGTYANLNAIDEKRSGAHLQEADIAEDKLLLPNDLDSIIELPEGNQVQVPAIKDPLYEEDKKEVAESKSNSEFGNKISHGDVNKRLETLPESGLSKNDGNSKAESPPAPVLPVDEKHDGVDRAPKVEKDKEEKLSESIQAALSGAEGSQKLKPEAVVRDNETLNEKAKAPKELALNERLRSETLKVVAERKKEILQQRQQQQLINNKTLPQNIDKEAIKKEEEVAAEELKQSKADKKSTEEELKKTKIELKETKELLERTVDKLKEELEKKNKETQELVVEKLGEVVEKVEQIERKVQKEQEGKAQGEKLPSEAVKPEKLEEVQAIKGSGLLGLLAEGPSSSPSPAIKAEKPQKQAQVYEPLSYKTGELMEHARNGSAFEQRLPLPLALLINASHIKTEDKASELQKQHNGGEAPLPLPQTEAKSKAQPNTNVVDAMRREILQFDNHKLEVTTESASDQHRPKRSVEGLPDFEAINKKLEKQNCLKEPREETLLNAGPSAGFDVKMKAVGRDLKAVAEDEEC